MTPLVIIPARLKSSRLPDKPLQKIGGEPLILHCWRRAMEADVGPVYVAADAPAIIDVIEKNGGKAVLTGDAHCGTDRAAIAAEKVDPDGKFSIVMNQQGDMPFISAAQLRHFAANLADIREMATACCKLGLVEVQGQDFNRTEVVSHIGLYAYTRDAIRRFHAMPQSPRELEQRLEQLRVVGKLHMHFVPFDHMPQEVNTLEDLATANALYEIALSKR